MLEAKYRIYDSAVLDAPIEAVWPLLRDILRVLPIVFGEAVKDFRWVDGSSAERIPSRFQFTLHPSGETVQEEVSGRSETDYTVTYRMIGQAVGITGYIATYQLRPITSEPGKTFVDWVREFAIAPGNDPAKVAPFLASLATQEMEALKKHFSQS